MDATNTISYGDVNLDITAIPAVSLLALAQRGLTHVLGNEVASKVHGWAGQEGQANSDDKATVKAWKDANAAAISTKTAELVAEAVAAINAGTLGVRGTSGPRLTPLDTVRRQIAKGQVETILRANKIKVPTKDEKVRVADGEFTMAELVDRRLVMVTKDGRDIGAEITKEAEKKIAAQAKANAAIAADAEAALAVL